MTTEGDDTWVDIIPAQPLDKGRAAFEQWKAEHGMANMTDAVAQHIRIDVIRLVSGGCDFRVRIRQNALRQLDGHP